jgi:DNA-binding SARP family transcriptional activator
MPEQECLLRIELLGPPRIGAGTEGLRFARRKAAGILFYLAYTQKPQSREELARIFWPNTDHSRARAALRTSITSIKALVPDSAFYADAEALALKIEHVHCDIELLYKARRQDCPLQERLNAADAWRGGFLKGFVLPDCDAFMDWVYEAGCTVEQELRIVLQELIPQLLDSGDTTGALRYATMLARLDPCDQTACRELMSLYADMGNRAGALREFERYATRVRAEYSQAPEPEIQELADLIRAKKTFAQDSFCKKDGDKSRAWRERGQRLLRGERAEDWEQALTAFTRASTSNPADAASWAGMAAALYRLASLNIWRKDAATSIPEAEQAIARALALNPAEPCALRVRARIAATLRRDFAAAEDDLHTALKFAPDSVELLVAMAELMVLRRDTKSALEYIQKARTLNPAEYQVLYQEYWVYVACEAWEKALTVIEELESIAPHPFINKWAKALVFLMTGDLVRVLDLTDDSQEALFASSQAPLLQIRGAALALLGRTKEAESILRRLQENISRPGFLVPTAALQLALGNMEESFRLLELAAASGDTGILYLCMVPAFRPLFDAPRYHAILKAAGLPQWDGQPLSN